MAFKNTDTMTFDASTNSFTFTMRENITNGDVISIIEWDQDDVSLVIQVDGEDYLDFEIRQESGNRVALVYRGGESFDFEGETPAFDLIMNARVRNADRDVIFDGRDMGVTVSLTDVNEQPTDLNLEAAASEHISMADDGVIEISENIHTTSRVKIASLLVTDPDRTEAFRETTFTLNGDDGEMFEIDDGVLYLKAGAGLDHETAETLSFKITYEGVGAVGAPPTKEFTIRVTDVNEQPIDLSLNADASLTRADDGVIEIREDTDTASRIRIADLKVTDPDDPETFPNTAAFTLSGTDAQMFEIDDGVLYLKAGAALDHETEETLSFKITYEGVGAVGAPPTKEFTIRVTDVNEQPTDLNLEAATSEHISMADDGVIEIREVIETPNGSMTPSRIAIANLEVTDPDDPETFLNTAAFTLSGGDGSMFEIDDGVLYLKAGAALDHETEETLSFEITAYDPASMEPHPAPKAFTIRVTDYDEPAVLEMLSASVDEGVAPRTVLATISGRDPEGEDVYYRLDPASEASRIFRIRPSTGDLTLRDGQKLDYEKTPSIEIPLFLEASAHGDIYHEERVIFTLKLNNVIETTGTEVIQVDDATPRTVIGKVTLAGANSVIESGASEASGIFEVMDGQLRIRSDAMLPEGKLAVDTYTLTLSNAEEEKQTVTLKVNDIRDTHPPIKFTVSFGGTGQHQITEKDVDGDDLAYVDTDAAVVTAYGQYSVIDGKLTYTPDYTRVPFTTVTDTFDVRVTDGYGGYTTVEIHTTVEPLIEGDLSTLNGNNGFRLDGERPADWSGISISGAGDVNNDGFDDVIIGAHGADPHGSLSGSSYVVFGKDSGFAASMDLSSLDGSTGFRLDGARAFDYSGYSVSGAGDINGDGYDDLVIGAYGADPNGSNSGSSYVIFGKASGFNAVMDLSSLDGSTGFRLDGARAFDYSGLTVSGAGDINGDGYDDIVIGAYGADPNGRESGSSYVIFGKASGFEATIDLSSLDGSNGFRLDGKFQSGQSGRSVSEAGDVNGDGYDDLIIGAHGASHVGSSYVVFGKASGFEASMDLSSLDGSNGFRLDGESYGDRSGFSVSDAGDINGDGYDDLVIGAYRADPNGRDSGSSYVVFGKASGFAASMPLSSLDGSNGFRIDGVSSHDWSGNSVSSAGDFNGDGYDDIVIGAYGADPNGRESGSSYVIFGKASGFEATIDLSSLDGSNGFRLDGKFQSGQSGRSVSEAGDVNGDGYDDLIIGAHGADLNGNLNGSSYVIFGFRTGFMIEGEAKVGATITTDLEDTLDDIQVTWKKLNADGTETTLATGEAYTIKEADLDSSIFATATFTNLNGKKITANADAVTVDGYFYAGDDKDNILTGSADADILKGYGGNDRIFAQGGDDILYGGAGGDTLVGHAGKDMLYGGEGNDRLSGWGGSDTLSGGAGNDRIYGGVGNDIFVLYQGEHAAGETNLDAVVDFAIGDKIRVDTGAGDETTLSALMDAADIRWEKAHATVVTSTNDRTLQDTVIYATQDTASTADDIMLMVLEDFSTDLTIDQFEVV